MSTDKPTVTVIIVPRESFGFTRESLESLYRDTSYPFELIYIDGGSPRRVRRYIDAAAKTHGFRVIRTEDYLSPNRARNLGRRAARTKYLVFADNDIVFKPGWLGRLVACAEETGAAIVGPLSCIGAPLHENIHNGGGVNHIEEVVEEGRTVRRISQKTHLSGQKLSEVGPQLERVPCDYVEFHTVLVRADLFDRIGPLDEGLLSTREHIDMCMLAANAGERIFCERSSVITYQPGVKPSLFDVEYFMLRWSDAWDLASLDHFREKWRLDEDKYFAKRYEKLGKRRHRAIIKPMVERLPVARDLATDLLASCELRVQRFISDRYARRHAYAHHSLGLCREQKAGVIAGA